jgi:hypothetical protein
VNNLSNRGSFDPLFYYENFIARTVLENHSTYYFERSSKIVNEWVGAAIGMIKCLCLIYEAGFLWYGEGKCDTNLLIVSGTLTQAMLNIMLMMRIE